MVGYKKRGRRRRRRRRRGTFFFIHFLLFQPNSRDYARPSASFRSEKTDKLFQRFLQIRQI